MTMFIEQGSKEELRLTAPGGGRLFWGGSRGRMGRRIIMLGRRSWWLLPSMTSL